MDLQLHGLRALVTGGTKGIGRAIVEVLAEEGASVALCARNEADVKETVSAVAQRGATVTGRALDVADGVALARWTDDVAAEFGGLDIVVANVSALAIGSEEENWRASFEVDMLGTVRLVNAALRHLERSEAASVLTVSSVSGREIDFAAGLYGAFKAALVHYTQGLAHQLAAGGSGPIPSLRATPASPAAFGKASRRTTPSCSAGLWR